MTDFIPVTVDKSHIITIGERLYTESIEFIRELVNNAYDADAATVNVTVSENRIEVQDDGTGMDREGLIQYFSIGSQEKLFHAKSAVYGRDRIGQFGIGKFASLAACETFEVVTRKGAFAARVVFDKMDWGEGGNNWRLPLEILPPESRKENGTTVILHGLTKTFRLEDVERRIREGTPLKASHFRVILNGHPVAPRSLSGHLIPFLEGTSFGPISGEIIILPETAASKDNLGIEVKVKQVTVKRALLGMETWGRTMSRIRGEVYADFLPVTSDRTGFLEDSPEYRAFLEIMDRIMGEVKQALNRLAGRKEGQKTTRAIKDALHRVYRALAMNPDLSPFGPLPIAGEGKGIGGAGVKPSEETGLRETEVHPPPAETETPPKEKKKRTKKPKVRALTPNAVIQRMRFGETGVSCVLDNFGPDGPEVFSEGNIIYINRDHPLYRRETERTETQILNLTRLLTQEISLMNAPRNPREAFDRQSKLLRDALVDEKQKED